MRKTLLAALLTVGGWLCLESPANAQVYIRGGYGGYYSPYVAPVYARPVYTPYYGGGYYGGGYYGGYRSYAYPRYYSPGFTYSNFNRGSGYSFSVGRGGFGYSSYNFGRGRRW